MVNNMADVIYLSLLIAAFFVETSPKCDTKNLLKKLGLTLIMLGAMLFLANKSNILIELGVICYFCANIVSAYLGGKQRRYYDKIA